ncbi:DUF2948 family protein [Asticcacaulis solisilvae]|uniref:DUF2948 family protein n=1 Tax=Asticcacaulis solisilvae TaxID=1217274 RepID=UPI003FD7DC6A
MKPLRLMAEAAEDVGPISALVQDAALRPGDMEYDAQGRHFTLRMNRFCNESGAGVPLRAPSVLRISCVTKVQRRGFDPKVPGAPLSLLGIEVEDLEAPAHALILRFAGQGSRDIRIEVECLDVLMMDLAAPRRAKSKPVHPV